MECFVGATLAVARDDRPITEFHREVLSFYPH